MKTIWKFPLSDGSPQRIALPKDAEILTVQIQAGAACLWALVESEHDYETRYVEVFGTGQPIHEGTSKRTYIATFQQPPFVWHVFERSEAKSS